MQLLTAWPRNVYSTKLGSYNPPNSHNANLSFNTGFHKSVFNVMVVTSIFKLYLAIARLLLYLGEVSSPAISAPSKGYKY